MGRKVDLTGEYNRNFKNSDYFKGVTMADYKITPEIIRDIAGICSDAREVMEKHFPEVFRKEEPEWVDITSNIVWKTEILVSASSYIIRGIYKGKHFCYASKNGIKIMLGLKEYYDYKIEYDNNWFKILKKGG